MCLQSANNLKANSCINDFSEAFHFSKYNFQLCLEALVFSLGSLIHLPKWDAPFYRSTEPAMPNC